MTRIVTFLILTVAVVALAVAFLAGVVLMPLVAAIGLLVGFLTGAAVGSAATARSLTGEMINADQRALAYLEAADRLQEEAEKAGVWVNRLRDIVNDQARIVRAALGRPHKRLVAAGSTR